MAVRFVGVVSAFLFFNLDLNNPIFINAVKAFSPLKIRLGGTLQDKVIYDTGDPPQPCNSFIRNTSEMFGFTKGCLPMFRWDELMVSSKRPNGSLGGPWDYTNAASLIRYTVSKGYTIHGWELGNELSGNGVGARIGADQYAADVISLHSIVNDNYRAIEVKPLILALGGFLKNQALTQAEVLLPNLSQISINSVIKLVINPEFN